LSLELLTAAWQTNSAKILAAAGDHVLVIVKVHGPVEARVVRVSDDRNHSWRQTWHGAGESSSEEVWRTEIKSGQWHEIWVTLDQPAQADLTLNRVVGASR
jgi:YD repeat-containing protein